MDSLLLVALEVLLEPLEVCPDNRERVAKVKAGPITQATQVITKVAEEALRTLPIPMLPTQVGLQYGAEEAAAVQMQVLEVTERAAAQVPMVAQAAQEDIFLLRLQERPQAEAEAVAFLLTCSAALAQQAVLSLPYLMEHKNGLCYR